MRTIQSRWRISTLYRFFSPYNTARIFGAVDSVANNFFKTRLSFIVIRCRSVRLTRTVLYAGYFRIVSDFVSFLREKTAIAVDNLRQKLLPRKYSKSYNANLRFVFDNVRRKSAAVPRRNSNEEIRQRSGAYLGELSVIQPRAYTATMW